MLFASQHSLIIKIFKVREKWGGYSLLAPLFRHPWFDIFIEFSMQVAIVKAIIVISFASQ